ncbi:Ig-like domain repeat protein [Cellulomonas soli]
MGELSTQSAANQVKSGSGTARPWATLTTQNACPAESTQLYTYLRIPQAGVPEEDWTQIPLGAPTRDKDAAGRYYTTVTSQADRLGKPELVTWLLAQPGNTGTVPFLAVCRDAMANPTGYFKTDITFTGTTSTTLSWSIVSPDYSPARTTTSTTLAVSSSAITAGDEVTLSATLAPAGATGDVEFFAGTTSLGTGTLAGGVATLATRALPAGTAQVTAVYAGDATYASSTSAPVAVTVAAAPARSTATTLAVDVVAGAPYQDVTLTATVAPVDAAGTVTFRNGSTVVATAPVTAGAASLKVSTFGAGTYAFTAEFAPTDPAAFQASTSTAVAAEYVTSAVSVEQTVLVTVPVGTISLTTPYTPTSPLDLGTAVLDPADSTYSASGALKDIVITDSRAGNLGFTASVVSGAFLSGSSTFGGEYAGLTDLVATQVAGNALQAGDVTVTDNAPTAPGLATPKVFASYGAGKTIGTARIDGVFRVDQVPSSVTPGQFAATVTFSVI